MSKEAVFPALLTDKQVNDLFSQMDTRAIDHKLTLESLTLSSGHLLNSGSGNPKSFEALLLTVKSHAENSLSQMTLAQEALNRLISVSNCIERSAKPTGKSLRKSEFPAWFNALSSKQKGRLEHVLNKLSEEKKQ